MNIGKLLLAIFVTIMTACGGSGGGKDSDNSNVVSDTVPTNAHTLSYFSGADGSISGTSPQTVTHGGSGSAVTAAPSTGYFFVSWSDGSTANPRVDSNVSGNIAVTANYAIKQYALTYTAGANGSISGTSPQTVTHGGSGSAVTAAPSTGYLFVSWSDGSTVNPRVDSSVSGNIAVTANFAIKQYALTYTAGANGSISGTSPQTVTHSGSSSAVTAVPSTGYLFVGWSDGSTGNPRVDSAVTGAISVTATFALMPPTNIRAESGDEYVTLMWSTGIIATNFRIYYSNAPGIDTSNISTYSAVVQVLDTNFVVPSLTNGTKYYFVVTLFVGADESRSSNEVSSMPFLFIPSGGINDTGIDWCADDSNYYSENGTDSQKAGGCEAVSITHPGQDGHRGRDASARDGKLMKTGGGTAGFDFTKISNSGVVLPSDTKIGTGTYDWACTRDNVTGLTWEVKVDDPAHARHKDHTYTWYNENNNLNGGSAGNVGFATSCAGTLVSCNTQQYAASINAQVGESRLCGATDWRIPSVEELRSVTHYGRVSGFPLASIDEQWFPNTSASSYWSMSPSVISANDAWFVTQDQQARADSSGKGTNARVRLVSRGGNINQCSAGAFPASTPTIDFPDHNRGGATVTHEPTGLTWSRCALGQTWEAGACLGVEIAYSWQNALAAVAAVNSSTSGLDGKHDWRVPNIKELSSIVERCTSHPAINSTIFPNTGGTATFWASSPVQTNADFARLMSYWYGFDGWYEKNKFALFVRMVRGGH